MSFAPPRTVPRTSSTPSPFLRLFFFFVSLHKIAFGDLTINTPQGLIDFSNEVNSGTNYSGTTVYLAADLDFNSSLSQQFQPIGNSSYFMGTFEGQGHVVSNINLTSSLQYIGLFGNLNGATIRNVVTGESCSFVSSYSGSKEVYSGVVDGYCDSCTIENVVNMGSVSFIGKVSNDAFYIGGIIGKTGSSNVVRNCVNYGPVTHLGTSTGSRIGGVIGLCGKTKIANFIQNCANYGTITHNGTTKNLFMGGVTSYTYYGANIFENCLSAGKIVNATRGSIINYIGGIVGYAYYDKTTITHCLWTSDVGSEKACGGRDSIATVAVENSTIVMLDTTTMDDLNEYTEQNSSWDKWFMLHLNGGTINNITQDTLIVTQKHFPDPVKEENTFSFWCTDAKCTDAYDPETTDITAITELYAGWNVYTVTFGFGNGTTETRNVFYDEKYGTLPDPGERAGWTFIGWFTGEDGSGDEITSETTVSIADDHPLYAHWTINNYTLTFILDNGESDIVKTLNYSDPIDYPGDPAKEGYIFDGWSENITTMPAHNLNITAQWTKVTEYVEIVFDKKDLSEGEIKTIISKYTNGDDNFIITNIETVNGETKVIVKFADNSKATEFVRNVNENKREGYILKVEFASKPLDSFTPSLRFVLSFFYVFLF